MFTKILHILILTMSNLNTLVGTCYSMCPVKEMKWRERNGLLHAFEVQSGSDKNPKADPRKIVKQFSRSAAGKIQASPADLRPSSVLLKTMNYLINNIIPIDNVPWITVYDFVNDRIQAIRQDMTIQMISDINAVKIFEMCIRFYILSAYLLCEEPETVFDQHLNNQQLDICLQKLLCLYEHKKSDAMCEFLAIHYVLNVHKSEAFYRSVIFYSNFKTNNIIKLSIKTCILYMEGNFIGFYKILKKLPVILLLCFIHLFPHMRKRAFMALNIAYNTCKFPVVVLADWLCMSEDDVIKLCSACNIKIEDKYVHFLKKDFKNNIQTSFHKKENFIDTKFRNVFWPDLIFGINQ